MLFRSRHSFEGQPKCSVEAGPVVTIKRASESKKLLGGVADKFSGGRVCCPDTVPRGGGGKSSVFADNSDMHNFFGVSEF